MSCLVIFDGNISVKAINSLPLKGEKSVTLFPLTSKQDILNQVTNRCHAAGIKRVKSIETGQIIDETADEIRDKYIEFIAKLPEKFSIDGKNLKEWFYYPDGGISLWWLSLVAEKNTFKSDSFNGLVQFYAVIRIIKQDDVRKIVLSCISKKLSSTLDLYCRQNSLSFTVLLGKERGIGNLLDRYHTIRAIIGAGSYLSYELVRWIRLRFSIKHRIERRINAKTNPVLLVTYYPNIDTGNAERGKLKNLYYLPLQEELEKQGRDIIWVAMYVQNTSISFAQSLQYAKRFIDGGYHFVFLDEFLTLTSFVKIVIGLLWSVRRFKKIERTLPGHHFLSENVSVYPIFQEDWYKSFCGATGVQGLLFLEAFKNMFKKLGRVQRGLYYCEMHAWEKALLAAKKSQAPDTKLFGYQHATISRMLLNYFNHPSELQEVNTKCAMPKPDKIACDGEVPRRYFRESGWHEDELTVVEAIRYSHLQNVPKQSKQTKDNVILVAFSISVEDSVAVLNMVTEGLKEMPNIKVWLKPHPFLPMNLVLQQIGPISDARFEIKEGQIEKLLPEAKGVIISESGVALEALAYGCRIITINLPDMVNMSPLRGIQSNLVKYVNSPTQLKKAVNELVEAREEDNPTEAKELINQFFYFNKTSARPEKFLELLS